MFPTLKYFRFLTDLFDLIFYTWVFSLILNFQTAIFVFVAFLLLLLLLFLLLMLLLWMLLVLLLLWLLLLLLLLLLELLSIIAGAVWCNGWIPSREFVFSFESQILTGIPEISDSQLAGQYSKLTCLHVQLFIFCKLVSHS